MTDKAKKVAVVTGGAQGIGKGIVSYLVDRNWRVLACDQNEAAGERLLQDMAREKGANDSLRFVAGDVSRESDVQRIIQTAMDWAGRLDALINNAGLADPETGPVEELSLEDWQRRLDVNLTGSFLMAKHAVPQLRKTRGALINMASTRALQSEANCEAYAATKGGLVALTHALAVSLGPEARVNSISPGWIDVRAWQANAPAEIGPLSKDDHQQHPAGRVGRPEDIAGMVHFLVSPESEFITGQNFVVDGGMTRKMIYEH